MSSFLLAFYSCFRDANRIKLPVDDAGNTMESKSHLKSCIFCDVSPQNGFRIVYEDNSFVAFHDRKPASRYHILLIPKEHIESVYKLRAPDVNLVKSMEQIGHRLLDNLEVPRSMRKMGFHIPPFNSVNHLHLHVQALPYKSFDREAKYPIAKGDKSHEKGFSWFVEVSQAIRILEKGGHITVFPC